MNKALHALVYLILILAVVALVFELNLYKKRELLGDRNKSLENFVVSFAKTIETEDAPKSATPPEINKDIQAVEAKAVENPDMENLLAEYPAHLEQTNLATFDWNNTKDRLQLRAYYLLDPMGQPVPDPVNSNKPTTTGPGTMSELLNKLFARATQQQANLNLTRGELAIMRGKLEAAVTELNKLKQDDRADKVTIEELKAKIAQLEEAKANLEEQVQQLKSQIEELNGEITSLKDEVQHAKDDTEAVKEELEKEKKKSEQLKKMLIAERMIRTKVATGSNGQTSAATLTTGEKGKIVTANNDLMFAVVEFTDAAMKELLGPNREGALPMLELDVKRKGFAGPAGERVGRIRLRVAVEGKNYVIADILGDWEQAPAEVGDVVFMD